MVKTSLKNILIIAAVACITLLIVSCGQKQQTENNAQKGNDMKQTKNPIIVFETSKGNFEVELYQDKAPITVTNFLGYVNEGFYDGLIFHRIMADFMIQGGGFDKDMNERQAKAPIKNEATNGLSNDKYTIAMARTGVIDSATSEFFINTVDNSFLNHMDNTPRGYGYAVFGKVISGTDTIDKIRSVPVAMNEYGEKSTPLEIVTINKAYVKK